MGDQPVSRKACISFTFWLFIFLVIAATFFGVGSPGGERAANMLTSLYLVLLIFGWIKPKYTLILLAIAGLLIPIIFGPIRVRLENSEKSIFGGNWAHRAAGDRIYNQFEPNNP